MPRRRSKLWHVTVTAGVPPQWETAKRVPDAESVATYLQAVGITGDDREQILELARGADDPSWLASGIPGASNGLAGVLECERTTTEMVEWCPLVMPGLLQTPEYAKPMFEYDQALSEAEVDGLVQVRIDRRKVLTDARDDDLGPAEYKALIGEYALRERVGGKRVLVSQLRQLLEFANFPTVTLRIVRSGGDWHPGLAGSFILYNFAESPSIVHLEHHKASAFLYDEHDITAYKVASSVIRRRAMNPDESIEFVAEVIKELERSE
jgi:hypothetical protein